MAKTIKPQRFCQREDLVAIPPRAARVGVLMATKQPNQKEYSSVQIGIDRIVKELDAIRIMNQIRNAELYHNQPLADQLRRELKSLGA